MIITILLPASKDVIHLMLFYSDFFSVIINAYIVKLFNFSYLTAAILIIMMF